MTPTLKIAYLGNFVPPHSTENHVWLSLESLGHKVQCVQEGEVRATDVPGTLHPDTDLFLWTQTYGLAETGGTREERQQMIDSIPVPTVAFHLDRWWGLSREHQVSDESFFRCDYVFTADGGHQEEFSSVGVNHFWSPPAVYHEECFDGRLRPEWECDVAFVGSWRHYGHDEWAPRRMEMLNVLRRKYGRRFRTFPIKKAIRGAELNDLYASIKVVVGDSCLAAAKHGSPITRYWSDRIPETTGRGGVLVHPSVVDLDLVHKEVITYPLGHHDAMFGQIDQLLADEDFRQSVKAGQSVESRQRNTYRNRMEKILDTVLGTGLSMKEVDTSRTEVDISTSEAGAQ